MAIQLIITGDHITDVFAEITNFAAAIGDGEVNHVVSMEYETPKTKDVQNTEAPEEKEEPKPKKLTVKEQEAAVEEMIEAGEIDDDKFELLTKGRQKQVDEALKEGSVNHDAPDDDLTDMFDDDETPEEVTSDMIREKMGSLGKDKDGNPVQENLLKIRDILTNYVPKGEDVKVGKIPQNKLSEVYAELNAMKA